MATVSNPATLLSIISTFGGASTLSSYLRGGSYVKNLPNTYSTIVQSLPLNISAFAGKMNPAIDIKGGYTDTAYNLDAGATATIQFTSAGAVNCSVNSGSWLLQGSAYDYQIYWLKTGGTTPSSLAVNTWIDLGTITGAWNLTKSTVGTLTSSGTLTVRMKESPQSNLFSASVYLEATRENSGGTCPNCCFTPDTLVTMADGTTKAIVMVMRGEWILTVNGGKKEVTEVITRVNRVMYEIRFADGRILKASEDHPLYVQNKGYASINPTVAYKDLGIPDLLYVGDLVLDQNGRENQIVSIELIDYPETVYTFAESEFYANGMLVY